MTSGSSDRGPRPWHRRPGQATVLSGLAERILGAHANRVAWHVDAGQPGFAVRCGAGIDVVAGDVLSAAHGLHRALVELAHRRVCWDTPLPLDASHLTDGVSSGRLRAEVAYYLNFCTSGYTTAAWDWDRWQREIDWMALHGITMPLATVGHEAVLAEVYRAAGLSDDEIVAFLGGPAYLPWQFMGCLDNWGAQLDRRWLEQRRELGRRIVDRQLEYGMTPVLPAFVGHVPHQLASSGTTTRDWWGFTTHLLDPLDDRFRELARQIVAAQADMLGTAHLYAADPFIEMEPPDDDPTYLANVANSLVAGLRAADPDAVWVLQAWTFDYLDWWTDDRIAHFLDSVPAEAMLVLDLWGEHSAQWRRFGGFRGKPWVWCTLHDFGGRNDAFGAAERTLTELHAALAADEPPLGVGLAMEATEQNHMIYELVLDRPQPSELANWGAAFAVARSGSDDPRAVSAWRRLLATVYATPGARHEPSERPSAITLRPHAGLLEGSVADEFAAARAGYPAATLLAACRDLADLTAVRPDLAAGPLGHDLVTAVATLAARAADALLARIVAAWRTSGRPVDGGATALLTLLDELDALLAHRTELRLATWEAAHGQLGTSDEQAAALRRDARMLVSVWNHAERAPLTDYSARLWAGLVAGLYRERWRVWLAELRAADGAAPSDDVIDRRIGEVTTSFVERGWPTPAATGALADAAARLMTTCATALDLPDPPRDPD
jgi:alpha-N-acetylglucosaminidase